MLIDFSNRELFNYKYIKYINEKRRYLLFMGGGGSGKSKFLAQRQIIKSFIKGTRTLGIRKVHETIKDSIYSELIQVINDWKLQDYFIMTKSPLFIQNKLTGSDFIFRGLDNVEKIKSVSKITQVWVEETTEINKQEWDQLDIRLRGIGKELQLIATFNPISDQHWLITDFWNKGETDDVALCHSTFKDNKFVGQEQYDKVMERLKEQDINLYNIYALGIPGKAVEGLVFTFKEIKEVPEEAELMGYGLDFGFNHPTVLEGIYKWNDGIIIDEELFKSGMITQDIIDFLDNNKFNKSIEIISDSSRPETIEQIFRAGYNCKPCKKGKDSVINGINLMKKYTLYVTAKSEKTKKDFNNYVWAKNKNGESLEVPVKAFDDGIDSARYGISAFFGNTIDYIFE